MGSISIEEVINKAKQAKKVITPLWEQRTHRDFEKKNFNDWQSIWELSAGGLCWRTTDNQGKPVIYKIYQVCDKYICLYRENSPEHEYAEILLKDSIPHEALITGWDNQPCNIPPEELMLVFDSLIQTVAAFEMYLMEEMAANK